MKVSHVLALHFCTEPKNITMIIKAFCRVFLFLFFCLEMSPTPFVWFLFITAALKKMDDSLFFMIILYVFVSSFFLVCMFIFLSFHITRWLDQRLADRFR